MFIPSNDWKIQKKLLEAGGLGPVVYIWPGRACGKTMIQAEYINELLKSWRTVVYGRPVDHKKQLGSRKPWFLPDRDILTPEQYERAERLWNEFWKGERNVK